MSQRDDEFIARDGQFPADTRNAQGTSSNATTAVADMQRTRAGEPAVDFNVRSVYDSRPVLGLDFNFEDSAAIVSGTSQDLTFIVPAGYVAVLKQIDFWMEPSQSIDKSSVIIKPVLNRAVQANNQQSVGSQTNAPMQLWLIADEFDEVGIRVSISVALASSPVSFVHLYGNLLAKTGRATPFEIANLAGRGQMSNALAPSNTIQPSPDSAPRSGGYVTSRPTPANQAQILAQLEVQYGKAWVTEWKRLRGIA